MLLKMLSITRGMTPLEARPGAKALPMVYVLPDPVWPAPRQHGNMAASPLACLKSCARVIQSDPNRSPRRRGGASCWLTIGKDRGVIASENAVDQRLYAAVI